jgi:DNA-binding NtrC family response regulator
LQYAVVKCRDNLIHTSDLPMELLELQREKNGSMGGALSEKNRRGPNRKLDLDAVAFALERSGNNKAKAARLLGVGRATLYRFLNDYPFAVPDGVRNS